MKVRKLGHACLLVEDAGARVLLDPGAFTPGWEELRGLTAVLVTHQHADHLDPDRIDALLAANPDAAVYADPGSAALLARRGHRATAVAAGERHQLGGLPVDVVGAEHAVIHPDIPVIPNTGYLIGDRLYHPGDAFTVPDRPVDILAVPIAAPWLKAAEVVEFVRAVAPSVAVPIHDALLSMPRIMHTLIERLGPADTALTLLDDGEPRTF